MVIQQHGSHKQLYPVVLELDESTLNYIQLEYGNVSHAASALVSAAVSALQHQAQLASRIQSYVR